MGNGSISFPISFMPSSGVHFAIGAGNTLKLVMRPDYAFNKKGNKMTEEQKESLKFYTINDYLLINGLLWEEPEQVINEYIDIINNDGRNVIKEAEELGFDKRWNCSKEEGIKTYKTFLKRFPAIDSQSVRNKIIKQAKTDINNMSSCLLPLENDITVYRNVKTKYVADLKENSVFKHKGFLSCSLTPHLAENAIYGSSKCSLIKIFAPKGTLAISIDEDPNLGNEADEIIIAPSKIKVIKSNEWQIILP